MMKTLITTIAIAMTAVFANAASVQWKMTATAAQENSTVYVFTSEIANSYDSVAALAANAIDSKTVTAVSGRGGTTYQVATTTTTDASIVKGVTDSLYFAIVKDGNATDYSYGKLSVTPYEGTDAPQLASLSTAGLTSSGSIGGGGDVPEPTTGLLVLLGVAGLSLKRKIA